MASLWYAVLFVAVAAPSIFGLSLPFINNPTWPPLSSSGTCSNSISGLLLTMFSPNSLLSTAVLNSIAYVNSTVICSSVSESEVASLRASVKIYLFYGPTINDYQVETLDTITNLLTGGHWNFSRAVTCFIPGWLKNATSPGYSQNVVEAYLFNKSSNILVVEWSTINTMEYSRVVAVLPVVAAWLAPAFDSLSNASQGRVTQMVFVGHSLGAHLCGYTSRRLTVLRIVFLAALDPAGPFFQPVPWRCQEGVVATDADFVMSLHSDGGRFGTDIPIGMVDYYPNNGTYVQPGCSPYDTDPDKCTNQFLCSHTRAVPLWCEAVMLNDSIIGRHCPSSSAFASGKCSGFETNSITSPTSIVGAYYFKTNAASPYGQGIVGADPV